MSRLAKGPWSVLAAVATALACAQEPTEPPKNLDRTPPRVEILLPNASSYDADGDGLVDFMARWSDSAGAVEPGWPVALSLRGFMGDTLSPLSTDLTELWDTVFAGPDSLHLEENFKAFLHDGPQRLVLSVRDTAGNLASDTISFTLPAAAHHATIDMGMPGPLGPTSVATDVLLTGEPLRGYVLYEQFFGIFDPDSMKRIWVSPNIGLGHGSWTLDEPRALVYLNNTFFPRLRFIDLATNEVGGGWPFPHPSGAVALSSNGQLLYYGEFDTGSALAVADGETKQLLYRAELDTTLSNFEPGFFQGLRRILEDPTTGHVFAASTVPPLGLVVFRKNAQGRLEHWTTISLCPAFTAFGCFGRGQGFGLAFTGPERLAVTVLRVEYRPEFGQTWAGGLVEINTRTLQGTRAVPFHDVHARGLAVSPSQRRIFVTGGGTINGGQCGPDSDILLDAATFQILEQFVIGQCEQFLNHKVAFHAHGNRVYVAEKLGVTVYLNRE